MRILISNDDGINAKGLITLAETVIPLGEVWIVAPNTERSACSHSLVLDQPIRIKQVDFPVKVTKAFSLNGTPADCIKISLAEILDFRPDMILSGINRGANLSVDVFYSGTIAAAVEGAFHGIPSMAFSLASFDPEGDYMQTSSWIRTLVEKTFHAPPPEGVILNVNFPGISAEKFKGLKVTRLAKVEPHERFHRRLDPKGHVYFWRSVEMKPSNDDLKEDFTAIQNGFISLSPLKAEFTDFSILEDLRRKYE
ncbi:MAG: 5'/3'-nucleotidase SurE [Candidatus Riflebacteria bacterium]|nr:5'/3'-nucleotidase SurE [Candidatus Riflebacteria bacterium]